MTAKEFFEQNRGKYFKIKNNYSSEITRVVGYNEYSILVLKGEGWKLDASLSQGISYIDESLINKEDKLWFTRIECLTPIDQPELDLCKLLEGCEGMTFYSSIHGDVILKLIRYSGNDPIVVTLSDGGSIDYCKDGRYLSMYNGECMLFPSKENRDWSTFKKPNKIKDGTPVMCKMIGTYGWFLRKFDETIITNYKWIVPVSEFDFTDFDSNKSKSIN